MNEQPIKYTPDADDAEWWRALEDGHILFALCSDCGFSWMRPVPSCPNCGSASVQLAPSLAMGEIYSWVTVHRHLGKGAAIELPYTVVVVELDEGARVYGRLSEGLAPTAGMRVVATVGEAVPPFLEFGQAESP